MCLPNMHPKPRFLNQAARVRLVRRDRVGFVPGPSPAVSTEQKATRHLTRGTRARASHSCASETRSTSGPGLPPQPSEGTMCAGRRQTLAPSAWGQHGDTHKPGHPHRMPNTCRSGRRARGSTAESDWSGHLVSRYGNYESVESVTTGTRDTGQLW